MSSFIFYALFISYVAIGLLIFIFQIYTPEIKDELNSVISQEGFNQKFFNQKKYLIFFLTFVVFILIWPASFFYYDVEN